MMITGTHKWKSAFIACLALAAIASTSLLIAGFEAHVINVTAQIEEHQCDPRSLTYWNENDGCNEGTGFSIWAEDISELSQEFSGVFTGSTGEEICKITWLPNCPSGNSIVARECQARAYAMALELNIAANRLNVEAFLAGADDGSRAFERLNLDALSTIKQALTEIEAAIAHPGFLGKRLEDAAHVAERIIQFYEKENPFGLRCIFDPDDANKCVQEIRRDKTLAEEIIDGVLNDVIEAIPDSPAAGIGSASSTIESATSTEEQIPEEDAAVETDIEEEVVDVASSTPAEIREEVREDAPSRDH